ncbi:MAG: hypothetical protein ACKVZJ_03760 [Phycisphaerales bacterium]
MSQVPRALVSQCVVGSACLVGLALGVLEPLHSAHRDAITQFEEAQWLAARAGEMSARMPALTAEQAEFAQEVEAVTSRSVPARDTARLNAGIEEIAARAGVNVERTQPRETTVLAATNASAAPGVGAPAVRPDAALGFSIDVSGSYGGLASFLRSLEEELGFTRVLSLRVTPEGEHEDRVRATITTAHYAFSLPKPAPEGGAATANVPEVKP